MGLTTCSTIIENASGHIGVIQASAAVTVIEIILPAHPSQPSAG